MADTCLEVLNISIGIDGSCFILSTGPQVVTADKRTATGGWMICVPFLAPVASLVLLSATTRALIVPTNLPR